ncbi:MAG: hypothetical protein AAF587_40565 [Bacteroidota bacterium]
MSIQQQVSNLDALVAQGQIIEAVSTFFADNVRTQDFDGTITQTKDEMLNKMNGFLGAIQQVNGITHHQTVSGDNVSFSEFTFDFDMQDGSKIFWHEILRREWQDGKVISEQHFKN